MDNEKSHDIEKKYLTPQEVADLFRVQPATVKNWRDAGLLDFFQPAGSSRVLYPKVSVEKFEKQYTKRAKGRENNKLAKVKRNTPGVSNRTEKEWKI